MTHPRFRLDAALRLDLRIPELLREQPEHTATIDEIWTAYHRWCDTHAMPVRMARPEIERFCAKSGQLECVLDQPLTYRLVALITA